MSYDAGTGRPGTLKRRSQIAVIALAIVSLLAVLLTLSATSRTADAQLSALPAGTTCFSFDESDDGSNALTHDSFLHTVTSATATAATAASITGNVENIAVRNDTGELYAYDAGGNGATDRLYQVDPATGAFSAPGDFGLAGLGDVDAMFFVNDEDGDPTNDVLWVLVDPNVLTGYDINAAVVGGPVAVAVPAGEGIEGATWLAEPAPGEFFIHYTTTGSGTTSILASLGSGTEPLATPSNIGGTEVDVEGFGTDGAGNMFLTTGGDSDNSLYSVTSGGTTNLIVDLAGVAGNADFESVDCASPGVTLTKEVTAGPTPNGDGTFSYEFTFTIENTGHLPLSNIVLTDPYVFTPGGVTPSNLVSTNNCPAQLLINATCTYVDTVDLTAAAGQYNNAATVDADGPFGQSVTGGDNVDFLVPAVDDPQLDIVKTVAASAADCPTSFTGGTAGPDTIEAAVGTTVTYCINVINNGPGDAINVAVQDSLTAVTTSIGALAANDQDSYNYLYVVTAAPETNTATVSGDNVNGDAVASASDTAGTVFTVLEPNLQIVKTIATAPGDCPGTVADGSPGLDTIEAAIGTTVTYCLNVVNLGPGIAEDVRVVDVLANLDVAVGTLAVNQEVSDVYQHVVGAEPETNTATITGNRTDGTAATSATDEAGTIAPPPLPTMQIVKSIVLPSQACPATYQDALVNKGAPTDTVAASVSQFVKYCINIINNGPGPGFNVTVSDPQDDNSPRNLGNLAAGAETSFLYLRDVLASPSTNVATVSAADSQGNPDASTDTDDAGVTSVLLGAIGSYVWEDVDGDGIQDAGEGVQGVTVTAVGPSGSQTAVTDANGEYLIDNLLPGSYTVTFTTPAGRTWTVQDAGADDAVDSDVNANGSAGSQTVVGGATNDTVDAGLAPLLGALGSYVWEDVDGDGIQDAGEGVQGVVVTAVGPSGTRTATTDANGEYLIDNLLPGSYTVTFTTPAGRTWTQPNAGANDAIDSDADASGNAGANTVTAGATNDTVDAGLLPLLGAIGTYVWEDVDGDGIQDAGEGVQGVVVTAVGPSGTRTATTDANGEYLIEDLLPGTYTVTFTTPAGRTWTLQDAGTDDAVDSDADASGNAGTHDVVGGATNETVDAGLAPLLGAIGTYVWEDIDEDGIQDAGEGVEGVTVTAVGPSGTRSDITDANGEYLIEDLLPGDYTVTFTTPSGRAWTLQDVGTDDAVDSDADTSGDAGVHPVVANQTNETVDAGLRPLPPDVGAIGTYVWEDIDQDGIQDAGEGVEGVVVTAVGPSGTRTDTTDANGLYLIENLLPGDYTVTFTTPAGRTWTQQNVGTDDAVDSDADASGNAGMHPVVANQTNETVDAGLVPLLGAIGSYVWEDVDEDGIQEPGEGVQGVVVTAVGPSGTRDATTDANGAYVIDNLLPGTYTVIFTTPAGRTWTQQNVGTDETVDSDPDAVGNAGTHEVVGGATNETVDAGLVPQGLGALGSYVWEDVDGDGIQEAGEGVEGVTVTAVGPSGTRIAVTNADGEYLIENLIPGDYTVIFTTPDDRTWTQQNVGTDDAVDSDADPSGNAGVHPVAANETNDMVDAGIAPLPDPGALSGYVWEDTDMDGIQDPGEGIEGITVTAVGPSGTETAVTGPDGVYLIDNLEAGDYTVIFTTPSGRTWTQQNAGTDDTVDSDADASGNAGVHTVTANETNETVDAGLEPVPDPGALSGYVWEDTNEDGIQDADEGIAGIMVTAVGPSGTRTAVTGADGLYLIDDLEAGDYTVIFTAPSGRMWTQQNAGSDDTVDSDADADGNAGVHTVMANQTNETVDAGLLPPPPPPGAIGSFVWQDDNGNGIQDAGEPGVEGVIVTAVGPGGTSTATTNSAGEFLITDLVPGTYTVTFSTPSGRTWTQPNVGSDDTVDSNADASGNAGTHVVMSNAINASVDAGLVPLDRPATVGNFVWLDENGNGQQDANEPGVADVTVNILKVDANGNVVETVQTVMTDATGMWTSGDLEAGDYIIEVLTPAGHEVTLLGDDPTSDTDNNIGANQRSAVITLGENEDNVTIDAGFVELPPELVEIGNFVWVDQNANGLQDADEPGVADVSVNIWSVDADGNPLGVLKTVKTGADGSYTTGGLPAGDYILQFVTPDGHIRTATGANSAADNDSNVGEDGLTGVITLAEGEKDLTVDAGFIPIGSIGDFIFNDANGNGIQDAGEAPFAGATIRAFTVDADGERTQVGNTAVSDANGMYRIDNLARGTYVVTISLPDGVALTMANAGGDDVDSDFSASTGEFTVELGLAQVVVNLDGGVIDNRTTTPPPVAPPEYPGPFKVVPNMTMNPLTPINTTPGTDAGTGGGLAHTGSQAPALAAIAIGLLCVGSVMMVGARRERYDQD